MATLAERLIKPLIYPFQILGLYMPDIPLLALRGRRGNFGFGLLLGYDVIEELEQIFEIF